MKFTLLKEVKSDVLMGPLLTGLLLFIILFLLSDLLQKHTTIGITINSAAATLYGNEAEFLDPISTEALLEIIHGDLFFMMMTLLTLSAVYGRIVAGSRWSYRILHSANLSALASILLLFVAFYLSSLALIPWLLSLWAWHLLALGMSLQSLYRLYR